MLITLNKLSIRFCLCMTTLFTDIFFFTVLKLLKTAEGIRKLLDTVAEALPQVSPYTVPKKLILV